MTWGHSYPLLEQVCTVASCLVYKDGRGWPRLDSAEHHRTGLEYLPKEFPVTFHDGPGLSVAHIRGSMAAVCSFWWGSFRNHHRLRSLGYFHTSKPPVSEPFTSDRPSIELEGTASGI